MNRLKFENNQYEEALEYVQTFSKTKEDGYYKVDLAGKSDQINCQQNNTLIALLTSLHYRLNFIEKELLDIKETVKELKKDIIGEKQIDQINPSERFEWKKSLDNITKDLESLSTGKIIKRPPKTFTFIYRDPPQPSK